MNLSNTQKKQLREEAEGIIRQAEAESRDMTEAEGGRVDAILDMINPENKGKTDKRFPRQHIEPVRNHGSVAELPDGDPRGKRTRKPASGSSLPTSAEDLEALDDGGFSGISEFLSSVAGTGMGRYDSRLESFDVRSQQGTGSGAEGGFIVPERFQNEVVMTATSGAPYLGMRDVVMLQDAGSGLVVPKVDDRDRSSDEYGGVALQRVSENTTLSDDQVTFASEAVSLKKAALLVKVSNELMSDAGVGVEAQLNRVFARAVQQRQELDFFSGSGAGEPLGFLNSGSLITASRDTSNEINLTDIALMTSDLIPGSFANAIWLAHPTTFEQLITMSDSGSNNVFIANNVAESTPTRILGRPLFVSSAAPALGNTGDLSLVDPTAYLYLQRPLVVAVSQHSNFDSDQVTFRVTLRDDGHPHYDKSVTDEQSQSLSEFVTLAA